MSAAPSAAPCTAKVSDGTRSAEAGGPDRRTALQRACAKMCAKGNAPDAGRGCVARCTVDIEAGKIGGQVRCAPPAPGRQ